jgi:tetratricopeptide (TPR) repeat protein
MVPLEAPPANVEVSHDKNLPKRTPHASTCVSFGDFREREAMEPKTAEADKQQMHDQARRAYQQALEIDPKCLAAYTGLARLYTNVGDHVRAVATYEKALKVHPKDAVVHFELGMCHARHKEWEPALASLHAALKLDPENRQYATTLGYSLARTGHFEESLALFATLEGKAVAHYKVARMAHHLHQDETAARYLAVALAEKPDLAGARQLQQELAGRQPPTPAALAVSKAPAAPAVAKDWYSRNGGN